MLVKKKLFRILLRLIIVVLSLCSNSLVFAQSDNYWSWNFNSHSELLAGSVVGGSAGSTSIFYNPSLIDNDSIPTLSVSANVLSLQFLSADNIAGDGIDVDKFYFKVQPRFVAYVFPTKNERFGLEAAILSPGSEEVNFTIQHNDETDVIQRIEGLETYTGYLKYSRRYDDTWAGFGFSYVLSDNFSVGVSSFVSIKTMKYTYQQDAQAFQEKDSVLVDGQKEAKYIVESIFKEELKYWDLSFVFKLGGRYKTNNDRFSFGINVTFPNIPIYGEGDIRKSYTRSNVYDNQDNNFTSNESNLGYDQKVKSHVKTPFSLAMGAQYNTKSRKNFISVTAEYFHSIDPYAIASLSSPESSNDMFNNANENPFLAYYSDAKSVTNVGVGFKQYISPVLFLLGGIRTDFTVASSNSIGTIIDQDNINRIHLDKYHFSFGPVVKIKKFRVLTGIQYTYGRNNDMQQLVSFTDPVEYIPSINQSLLGKRKNNVGASLNEIALFLGVTVEL